MGKETIADLHIHSRFSRATSKDLTIENLERYARIKGIDLLGTGDFTHPLWFDELDKLEEREGLLYTKTGFPFVWQTEISLVYTQDGKGRRIHYLILAPDKETVKRINAWLGSRGRLDYDGRPIFGFSSIELVDGMMGLNSEIEIIPAHAWTPWFGIFGSMSGFNSLKDAFHDREKFIHAIETGMSSDPEMNWRISELNNRTIVSFSDLHSFWPWRIGREATIFSEVRSYKDIISQIRENKILGTMETDPAYGKYHWDGHRLCKFSSSPEETKKIKGICPVCGKPLVIGVGNRVEELANQDTIKHPDRKPFHKILPLHELIALATGSTLASKKTWGVYNRLIEKFGSEINILLKSDEKELIKALSDEKVLFDLVIKNRKGKLKIKPGFDGEYGVAILEAEEQKKLF